MSAQIIDKLTMLFTAKFKSWTIIMLLATSVSCATCSSSNLHDYLFTQEGSGDTTHLLLPTTHVNPTTAQPSYSSMSIESNCSTTTATIVITSTVTVDSISMLPWIVVSSVLGFIVIIMCSLLLCITFLYLKLKRNFKGTSFIKSPVPDYRRKARRNSISEPFLDSKADDCLSTNTYHIKTNETDTPYTVL